MSTMARFKGILFVVILVTGQFMVLFPGRATGAEGPMVSETGTWIELTPMNDARYDHTMHVLQNDTLIVIGGTDGLITLGTVEVFNTLIGEWSYFEPMSTPRSGHASVGLMNGTILVIGGYDDTGAALASAELLDPSTLTWTAMPDMPYAAGDLDAKVLKNGSVLIVGGNDRTVGNPRVDPHAAIFDAANLTWSTVQLPTVGSMGVELFRLLNQTVMMVGGSSGNPWYDGLRSTGLYDHVTETWTSMPDMLSGRHMYDGLVLSSGKVLVTGGIQRVGPGYNVLNTTECYNTSSEVWEAGPDMLQDRYGHTATLLADGEVLVAGGMNATSVHNGTEVVQTRKGVSVASRDMHIARTQHAAVRNSQGNVIVSGGLGTTNAEASVEMFVPGVKEDGLAVEVFAVDFVASEGHLDLSVHTYNDTTGHVDGVLVTFEDDGSGTFDVEWGLSDQDGIVSTTYNAPRNTGSIVMDVDLTIKTHKKGYKDVTEVFKLEVFPETKGEVVELNDSIYHLAYVTTYQDGSPFVEDSSTHSGIDLIGDELVTLDGIPTVVTNISTWERVDKTFMNGDMVNHFVTESTGYYYYELDLQGVVYSWTSKLTRGHTVNGANENWYNISEVREITYLPAKRWFNTSVPVMGVHKEVVNTYLVESLTTNLDTGSKNNIVKLEYAYKDFVLTSWTSLDTIVGPIETNVFLDETGLVYDYYDEASGILFQTVEYNATGALASTKTLIELNDVVGEDPTSPLLELDVTIPERTILASTSTDILVTVTSVGVPVVGADVEVKIGEGGSIDRSSGMTDAEGRMDVIFTADRGAPSTTVDILVLASCEGHRSNKSSSSIMVVEDHIAPTLVHRPVTSAQEGTAVTVYALAMDDIGLEQVLLLYRIDPSNPFMASEMEETLGAFKAVIPTGAVSPPMMQYYISAVDVNGNEATVPAGGAQDPYNVSVTSRIRLLPVTTTVLMGGGSVQVSAAVRGNLSVLVQRAADPGPDDGLHMNLFARLVTVGDGELIWANMTFSYREPMVTEIDESELMVYRWDGTGSLWEVIEDTGVMTSTNKVWANVTQLSIFAPRARSAPVIPDMPDIEAPSVTITGPVAGARLGTGVVIVNGIAFDNVGLTSVEVRLDDGQWISVWVPEGARTSGWSLELALPTGPHTISVRAVDTSGNVGDAEEVEVMVFKENPTDGSEVRFAIMALISIIVVLIITLYLVGGRKEVAEPDEEDAHHGPHEEDGADHWDMDEDMTEEE